MAEPEDAPSAAHAAGGALHGLPKGTGDPAKRKRDQRVGIAALVVGIVGALLAWLSYRRAQGATAAQSYPGGYGSAPTSGTGVVPGGSGYDAAQGTYDQAIIQALAALGTQIQGLGQQPPGSAPPQTVPPPTGNVSPVLGAPVTRFDPVTGRFDWSNLSTPLQVAPHAQSPAQTTTAFVL